MFAQEFGAWTSNGKGNLILSTYPIESTDRYDSCKRGSQRRHGARITVNGRDDHA